MGGIIKIQICGYSGSGKSTLARALGEKYNIPVLHMDSVNWYGNWQYRSDEEKTEIVNEFLSENESWVIDGNYTKICPQRFSECDLFILVQFNRFYCFNKCYARYKKYKGMPRPDLPCGEKFDFEFAWWILFEGRTRKRRKSFRLLAKNAKSALVFKSRRALNRWLREEGIVLDLTK